MCQGICKNRREYFDTWKLSERQFTKTVFAITVPKRLGIDYITILNRDCEFDFYRLLSKRLSIVKTPDFPDLISKGWRFGQVLPMPDILTDSII